MLEAWPPRKSTLGPSPTNSHDETSARAGAAESSKTERAAPARACAGLTPVTGKNDTRAELAQQLDGNQGYHALRY